MAAEENGGATPPRKPQRQQKSTELLEAASIITSADLPMNAVRVEIADQAGRGFVVLIGPAEALALAMRLALSISRLGVGILVIEDLLDRAGSVQ